MFGVVRNGKNWRWCVLRWQIIRSKRLLLILSGTLFTKLNSSINVNDFVSIDITKLIFSWSYYKGWFEVGLHLSFARELISIGSYCKSWSPAGCLNFSGSFRKIWFSAVQCLNMQQIILQTPIWSILILYCKIWLGLCLHLKLAKTYLEQVKLHKLFCYLSMFKFVAVYKCWFAAGQCLHLQLVDECFCSMFDKIWKYKF